MSAPELPESEALRQYRAVVEAMPLGLTLFDAHWNLVYFNERLNEIGVDTARLRVGMPMRETFALGARLLGADAAKEESAWREREKHLRAGQPFAVVHRMGAGRALSMHARPTRDGGWCFVYQDASPLVAIENDFRERSARMQLAIDGMPCGLSLFDEDSKLVLMNGKYLELYGYDPSIIKPGVTSQTILGEWDRLGYNFGAPMQEFVAGHGAKTDVATRQLQLALSNGRLVEMTARNLPEGGWVTVHEDVTEQERRLAWVAEQNVRFDAALNNIKQGLCMFGADRLITVVNERYLELFGLDPEVVKPGTDLRTLCTHAAERGVFGVASVERRLASWQAIFDAGEPHDFDQILVDGRVIDSALRPMSNGGWIGAFEDVTEQRQLEAERAAALDDLKEQNIRFDGALNSMVQGLMMIDSERRLIVANRRYVEIFQVDPALVQPGVLLDTLIADCIARGLYVETNLEAVLEDRREKFAAGKSVIYDQRFTTGRTVEIAVNPMPDGKWILTFHDVTERRAAELANTSLVKDLVEQNFRFDNALGNMAQGLVMFDADQRLIVCNQQYLDLLDADAVIVKPGISLREMFTYYAKLGHFEGDIDERLARRMEILRAGKRVTYEHQYARGRLMQTCITPIENGGWVATIEDVTASRRLERERAAALEELKTNHALFNAALDSMRDGLTMIGQDFRIQIVNRRYCELFGFKPADVVGRHVRDVVREIAASGLYGAVDPDAVADASIANVGTGNNVTRALADGRFVTISHVPAADGGWTTVFQDVTERHLAQERVWRMARHDALTGLANRAKFLEELEQGLGRVRETDTGMAVLCLDLDGFKNVNDTLGHPLGDELLKIIASRLDALTSENVRVARFGGDEFALIAFGEQPHVSIQLARQIEQALAVPVFIDGHEIETSGSIGIALAPTDGDNPDDLIRCADMALYRAKADGRGGFAHYEPWMNDSLLERRALENDLRKAIANSELVLHFQPQVRVADGELVGMEALLRWNHPRRGLVPPSDFIPLAEEAGLIVSIGEWVLREACKAAAWLPSHVRIAVNLSPVQFAHRHSLLATVTRALADSGLTPNRLELEITEAVLLRADDGALTTLHQLRTLGISISMDDFGTGYSSLSYLSSFPFDRIKIDRSFMHDLELHGQNEAIVRAVIMLGQNLGIATTAEGVETAGQLEKLRQLGCTEAQGFYFGKPAPLEQTLAGVSRGKACVA